MNFHVVIDIHELKNKVNVRITVKLLKHEDPSIHDVCQFHHADDFTESRSIDKVGEWTKGGKVFKK